TDILPTFKTPAVQIVTFYPGMPAEVMEKDITTRLERWTGQSNGIARQEAKSMVGVSVVKDFFREDIDPNTAMSHVTSLAMSDLFYLPTGNAKFGALDYQINTNGMVPLVAQLNDLPLRVGNGPPTYIRDVAKVEDSHQIQTNIVRVHGKRQVYIPIYRQPGANTIAVVESIKAQLKPILERIKGINLDVVMDQSVYVRQAIRNLAQEAGLGFLLAAAMVFAIWTSRLLASTFVPVCAARFFKQRKAQSEDGRESWFDHVRDRYTRTLDYVLQSRRPTLVATATLFIVSMIIFRLIGTELFPQSDAGQFTV